MKLYFTTIRPKTNQMLYECGVKHVHVTFQLLKQFKYKLDSFFTNDYKPMFTSLMITGRGDIITDYMDFIRDNEELLKQFTDVKIVTPDLNSRFQANLAHYRLLKELDFNICPILTGNWIDEISEYEKVGIDNNQTIYLGSPEWFVRHDYPDHDMLYKLPKKYKYCKPRAISTDYDSCTTNQWTSAVRYGSFTLCDVHNEIYTCRIDDPKLKEIASCHAYNLRACRIDIDKAISEAKDDRFKLPIAVGLKPFVRLMRSYNDNFRF